eukprot:CAMPEP_0170579682 /NCGR_PEP_ID=MMETSP0224-20130122/6109_1 /TAXON_ID=285029 /ORGANISM="Togula jolla, Strain CCCM 725" /LENGTH=163 /DNA_ID=CAMNT_0010902713 /DNA_START=210 /DNA_END=703 /DNA_ORIENTATION=+
MVATPNASQLSPRGSTGGHGQYGFRMSKVALLALLYGGQTMSKVAHCALDNIDFPRMAPTGRVCCNRPLGDMGSQRLTEKGSCTEWTPLSLAAWHAQGHVQAGEGSALSSHRAEAWHSHLEAVCKAHVPHHGWYVEDVPIPRVCINPWARTIGRVDEHGERVI